VRRREEGERKERGRREEGGGWEGEGRHGRSLCPLDPSLSPTTLYREIHKYRYRNRNLW
jgi:hypothetical protein